MRGTASVVDWKINLNDAAAPFFYFEGEAGQVSVHGFAHQGMLYGAQAILGSYGVREIVYRLMVEGYSVRTIGHSLGNMQSTAE